jgi:hypothetical protein
MAGNSLTGSFNLSSRYPALFHRFDTKRPESKLMAPLGIPLHSSFLCSPEFGPFRL